MIITCPHCQTRYKVANDAIGAVGRQVQCAACQSAWLENPDFSGQVDAFTDPDPDADELAFRSDDDTGFSPRAEALADSAFVAQGGEPSQLDIAKAAERMQALAKRKLDMTRALPFARLQRLARIFLALAFVALLGLAIGLRTEIVRAMPELDAIYRSVGLGTNVVGLTFSDVKTLRTTRDGNAAMVVSAKIINTTNRINSVPPVLVSMVNADEEVVYQWSVAPKQRNLLPGDVLGFETQLTTPPSDAVTVRLTFLEGHANDNGVPGAN